MADMSKAERLAAARRKLQDYQKSKGRPLASNTDFGSNSPEPPYEQNLPLYFDPNQIEKSFQPDSSHSQTKFFNAPSNLQLTSESNNDLNYSTQDALSESNVCAMNGFELHQSSKDDQATPLLGQHRDIVAEESVNVPFTSPPKVFCASSFFDSVSGFSLNSPDVSDGSVMQQIQQCADDASLNTASHLFSSSNDYSQSWNVESLNTSTADSLSTLPAPDTLFVSSNCDSNSSENLVEDVTPKALKSLNMEESKTEAELPPGGFSTESIRQLSDQMNQLLEAPLSGVDPQSSPSPSHLELKNQELASQLASERRNNQQLQFSLKESQSLISHLEGKVSDLQSQQEIVLARHLGPLQEQLRAHAQTVGILVGEKTELEAALAHHTTSAKQHTNEVEELQNRLRASRHRVSELEKELSNLSLTASVADKQRSDHAHELDQLRLQNCMLSKQLEDAVEEASELRQKLSSRVTEVEALEQKLQDKESQLSLAQLRVTQLSSTDNPEASAEIESLHQHKISLEIRCAELLETVQQLTAERDQADQQYQQYVAQLNEQLQSVFSKLQSTNSENNVLRSREEDLVRNMSELERQLQQLQVQHFQNQLLIDSKVSAVCSEDHSGVFERVSQLEEDRQNLMNSLDMQTQEMSRLKMDLEEREARIAELVTLSNEKPNQTLLLAAMESDKVAAAQATSQNTILKQQLQELQDGFIKMSNDKLHLTENLEHEKHVNKELGEKISQLAEELHELRVSVSEKEHRLQQYQQMGDSHNLNQENSDLNHNHTHDHKHEGEDTHEYSIESDGGTRVGNGCDGHPSSSKPEETAALQEQLIQAKDHIHNLSSQNNSLRRLLAQKSTESHESGSSSSATEGATTDDATADIDTNCDDVQGKGSSFLSMQFAMEKLQERFTRTIAEVADLTEEKQRLEHLVLQLQGETETIGEYVTLYQIQRSALQQRAKEKDHQLACLSAEKEDLRQKLNALNTLVHRLIQENGSEVASEALPTHLEHVANGDVTHSITDAIELHSESGNDDARSTKTTEQTTAGRILTLLSEIGSSSLVDNSSPTSETFHPCPWCSGRLITV